MPSLYALNSVPLFFSSKPLLYVAIAFGIFILIHSFCLHKFKVKTIRVITDIAAWALILTAVAFLVVMVNPSASLDEQVVLQNIITNAVCGAIIQGCDNFITFTRYEAVAGKASRIHKALALSYVFIFLYLSWWPFFSVLPCGWNMMSPNWSLAVYVGAWVYFLFYLLYDAFYSGMVVYILLKHIGSNSQSHENRSLRSVAVKALCHSACSTTGIFCYFFSIPLGIAEYAILVVGGIHIFLNWKDCDKFFCRLVSKDKSTIFPSSTMSNKQKSRSSLSSNHKSEAASVVVVVVSKSASACAAGSSACAGARSGVESESVSVCDTIDYATNASTSGKLPLPLSSRHLRAVGASSADNNNNNKNDELLEICEL